MAEVPYIFALGMGRRTFDVGGWGWVVGNENFGFDLSYGDLGLFVRPGKSYTNSGRVGGVMCVDIYKQF